MNIKSPILVFTSSAFLRDFVCMYLSAISQKHAARNREVSIGLIY